MHRVCTSPWRHSHSHSVSCVLWIATRTKSIHRDLQRHPICSECLTLWRDFTQSARAGDSIIERRKLRDSPKSLRALRQTKLLFLLLVNFSSWGSYHNMASQLLLEVDVLDSISVRLACSHSLDSTPYHGIVKPSLPKKQWFVDFQRPKIRPELLFETKLLCQFSATQPFIVECMTSKMFGFLKGHIQCMRFAVLCTVEIIEKLAHASKNSFKIKCTKWFMLRLSEHLLIISSTGRAMWWCAVLQGHWNTALCSPRFVPQQSTAMGEKW